MLTPDRQKVVDESLGEVTLVPWLCASAEERGRALHPFRTLDIVERCRRRGRRALAEVYGLLALDRGAVKGLSDERLAEEVLAAVKARQLIALPGWTGVRAEPAAPPIPVELPLMAVPPARVRKEATDSDAEPTIRLVNLESPYFVPHEETIRISYAIDGPLPKAAEVRMKVKSLGRKGEPKVVEVRTLPAPHEAAGSLLWNGEASMEAGYITLRGAPYEVAFELTSTSGHVSVSEVAKVAVTVSSILLRVDASGLLPVDAKHQAALEDLVSDLQGGLPGDCSGRLAIDGPVFPARSDEMKGAGSFIAYSEYVPDGVAVPLALEVRFKSKSGGELRSPSALVGTRVLWDFGYQSAAELAASLDARGIIEPQRGFVLGVLADREKDSLPSGTGAPRSLGGRRGGRQSPAAGPPQYWEAGPDWPIEKPTLRTWGAFTRCGGGVPSAADGGAYFRSGRLAGDVHRLRAGLDLDENLDSNDEAVPIPPQLQSNTITMTNWRRVPIVADWFVGDTEAFDHAAIRAAFRPAALIVEPSPGVSRTDMTEEWTRMYARVAMQSRDEAWPFLADALEPDPQDQAIRFRQLDDFHDAPGARTYRESVRRRALNFLVARNEAEYKGECERHAWAVLDRLTDKLEVPSGGVTLMKFGANRLHNMQDQSTEIGGLSLPVGRHAALVLQFTHRPHWKVTTHEIGHALFLAHAPGRIKETRDPLDVDPEAHAADSGCMMSYAASPNFCGLCLLKLGGYDYRKVNKLGRVRHGK